MSLIKKIFIWIFGFGALVTLITGLTGGNTKTTQTPTVSSNTATSPIAPTTPVVTSLWSYTTSEDKMRNATTQHASITSINALNFEFPYNGGSTTDLTLRKSPKFGNDAIITISKGQFSCASDCTISVKFDNGKIEKYSATEPSDGTSNMLFITPYSKFVTKLKKAKHLVVEAEFYNEGVQQIEFEVSGLTWK
jgi:hypothetical protein